MHEDRLDGLSGLSRNTALRLSLIVHLLGPLRGHTPWWSRASGLCYTHTAFEVGNKLWDQPINYLCECFDADDWCQRKLWAVPREYAAFRLEAWIDSQHVAQVVESLEGRRGQPLRTLLQYLHLWPWSVWNCVTSVVTVLDAMGFKTSSETPDELHRFLQYSVAIPSTISRMGPSVDQIA